MLRPAPILRRHIVVHCLGNSPSFERVCCGEDGEGPRMRRKRAAAIALFWLAAMAPAQARDPQIGRILEPGEQPAEGSAVLRLTISPNGRATGCAVEQSSGSAETDAAACRFLTRRGEWHSRRDEQGRRIGYDMEMEVFREFLIAISDSAR